MDTGTLPETNAPELRTRSGADQKDLSVVDMVHVFLRYKTIAFSTVAVILLGAVAYAFTATPMYRAEITLAPARGAPSGLGSMISQFGGALGSIGGLMGMGGAGSKGSKLTRGEALTTLTSTAHIQNFIRDENLLPILFDGLWDSAAKKWTVSSDADIPTLSDGYDLFNNKLLKVGEDPITGIVTMSVEWKDPKLAADWANNLVGTLNSSLRTKAIEDSDKTIAFLNQELERTKVVELRQSIFFMIEQQIGEKTGARVQDEYAFKIINPAIAPDRDKYFSPDRTLIIAAGLLLGLIAGVFSTFLAYAVAHLRKEYTARA